MTLVELVEKFTFDTNRKIIFDEAIFDYKTGKNLLIA